MSPGMVTRSANVKVAVRGSGSGQPREMGVDAEQNDAKKWSNRQFAFGAAAAIVGIAISVYMTGFLGAIGIVMLAIGFGGLGPGLAYLMGNRSINFLHATAFRACLNILMIAVIVLFVYKGVPIAK